MTTHAGQHLTLLIQLTPVSALTNETTPYSWDSLFHLVERPDHEYVCATTLASLCRDLPPAYVNGSSIEFWLRPMSLPPPCELFIFLCQLRDFPALVETTPFAVYSRAEASGTLSTFIPYVQNSSVTDLEPLIQLLYILTRVHLILTTHLK